MSESAEIQVIPKSLSTSKRKSGEDQETMLNISAELMAPDDDKVKGLFSSTRKHQSVSLDGILGHLSSLRCRRPADGEETVNLVFVTEPSIPEAGRLFALVRDGDPVPLKEAQGSLWSWGGGTPDPGRVVEGTKVEAEPQAQADMEEMVNMEAEEVGRHKAIEDPTDVFYGRRGHTQESPAGEIAIGTPVKVLGGEGRMGRITAKEGNLWSVNRPGDGDLGLFAAELLRPVCWCDVHEQPYDQAIEGECPGCVADAAEKAKVEAKGEPDKFAHPQATGGRRGRRNG